MKQKIFGILFIFLGVFGVIGLSSATYQESAYATLGGGDCGASNFLGFRPWYKGLCSGDEIQAPEAMDISSSNTGDVPIFVWTIILNIAFDLTIAVSYIAIAMIIWAGIQYMASSGDPGKAQRAQVTLTNAITGVVITMVASVIINTVQTVLQINFVDAMTRDEISPELIQSIFNWLYAAAGLVVVIFIVVGAFNYLTAAGDPNKAAKATRSIIYSVIGLAIVILAAAITTFVVQMINGAL